MSLPYTLQGLNFYAGLIASIITVCAVVIGAYKLRNDPMVSNYFLRILRFFDSM